MNILFISISFPDPGLNPNLYTDLATRFKVLGHNVYVVTILEHKLRKETYLQKKNGLNILRVRSLDHFNVGFLKKGISTLMLSRHFIRAILKFFYQIKFDLCIYPTPPVTFLNVIKWIKQRDNCWTYQILRDIFPQNARDLGILNNHLLFKYFRDKEKGLYEISDYIGCMSEMSIKSVIENNKIDEKKLEVLPNWKQIRKACSETKKRIYLEKYGLKGKFFLIFGGVLGIAQEIEFLLELAKLYKKKDNIVFLIIGEGNQKKKLKKIVKAEKLNNVIIKDRIPSEEFRCLLLNADVGLVNLNRNFSFPNFPSKTLDYFETKIPVLASIDMHTDYSDFLDKAQAGLWSRTGDIKSYKENFETLYKNPNLRKKMGINGYNYLKNNLTVENVYRIIMKHFDKK
jgi:glycosyltransferase involved in cell wall biosynthesis